MRTLVALLTTLSMLHLTVAVSDVACASHERGGHAMPGMAMTGASHAASSAKTMGAAAASGALESAGPAKDCATPTQTRCCEAMTSCAVFTMVSVVERLVATSVSTAGTTRLATAVLVSVLLAPEPPPPKA